MGKDVCNALGYTNNRKAIADHVDPEDKQMASIIDVTNRDPIADATSGGWIKNELTVINESGLYSLVLQSKLPAARAFKRWVTFDVLPAIRQYGFYATPAVVDKMIHDPDFLIKLLQEFKKTRSENTALHQQVAELKPKATYCDTILNCKDLVSVGKIAKDYGMSAVKFNLLLHNLGIQFKQGGLWLLYQKYSARGWTQTKTFTPFDDDSNATIHTYWTQKGRLGLYNLLKSNGVLPLIERNTQTDLGGFNDENQATVRL